MASSNSKVAVGGVVIVLSAVVGLVDSEPGFRVVEFGRSPPPASVLRVVGGVGGVFGRIVVVVVVGKGVLGLLIAVVPGHILIRYQGIYLGLQRQLMQSELKQLFQILKNDPEATQIDKSSLYTLLKHINLEENCRYFFVYLKNKLENDKAKTISFDNFKRMFLNPTIQFSEMTRQEITELFILFDERKQGAISPEDVLRYYRQSEDYKALSKQGRSEFQRQVQNDFKVVGKESKLNPEEFKKILNFGRRQQME